MEVLSYLTVTLKCFELGQTICTLARGGVGAERQTIHFARVLQNLSHYSFNSLFHHHQSNTI